MRLRLLVRIVGQEGSSPLSDVEETVESRTIQQLFQRTTKDISNALAA